MSAQWFSCPAETRLRSAGTQDQNRAAMRNLLDCLRERCAIRASHADPATITRGVAGRALVLCQSSGSSGGAKTIRRSQASWIASFEVNRDLLGVGPGDCYAVLGQLGHSLSLYAATEALHLGAGLMVLAGDGPRSQLRALHEGRASILYATPAQLRRMLGLAGDTHLPALRHVICGGGKLDETSRAAMQALCPNARIAEFYGASETSFVTLSDGATPPGSVGKPYPGVRLELSPRGEIWVASPYLFQGYEETGVPDIRRRGDYVSVGDIGMLDQDGNLFLRGRGSRMVTVADRNVFLEDVETRIAACAPARLAAAVAVPDAMRGHAVLAFVEGAPDDGLARRIRDDCRARLGDHAVPRRVIFLPALPMLPAGKPDLRALAALA